MCVSSIGSGGTAGICDKFQNLMLSHLLNILSKINVVNMSNREQKYFNIALVLQDE